VHRLIAAEEQREQPGEGHLGTLIPQPVPAADQHPGYDGDRDARDPRSQQHAGRDGQGRAEQEPGHVLDTFAQGTGHRGVNAQQRRERREVRIGLTDRIPGQRPRPHRGDRPLTASRTWSCQYRTGPDEAGRSGTASREDHTRFRCCPVGPVTPLPSIRPGYPETGASHLGKGPVPLTSRGATAAA
jgi:hypothetical protein